MSDKELEELLAQRDEIDRRVASRQQEMAVLFTDIVGSTELFERRGDLEGVAFIHRHNRLLFPVVEEHRGRIVKTIGDAIMAVFDDPADAVRCGASMQLRLSEARRDEPGESPIHIKVGIHFGKLVRAGDDVFGDAVNTAARVQGKAAKDEVLISRGLHDRVSDATGIAAAPRGAVALKGKAEPLPVASLRWGPEAPEQAEAPDGDAGSMPELFVLEIARATEGLKVAAIDGAGDKGPVKSYAEVPLASADLERMAGRMAALLGGSADSYADRMREAGGQLFEAALSDRARRRLRETPRRFLRLQVEDSLAHVPWELLHDGESHLCLKLATGRVVAAREEASEREASPNVGGSHALVVSNPTGDLPESAREGEVVAGLLAEGFGGSVRHLQGPVRRDDLLEALEGARLLHFAGHVARVGDPRERGFLLCDGSLTPAEAADRLAGTVTDLVFTNACNASEAAGWTDAARGTFDLASTLLKRGVRHYLGPIGAIDDSDALAFALRFYEEILMGVHFGEAARRAREDLFVKGSNPLSFARYVLYGEPRTRLSRDSARLPARGPTRADPLMPPGAAVSDGIPIPPPSMAFVTTHAERRSEDGEARAAHPSPGDRGLPALGRGKGRTLAAAVAGIALLAAGAHLAAGLLGQEEVAAPAPATEEAEPRARTGDVRMTVLGLQPMGGRLDEHLTERVRNTLNFALVGAEGIQVTERDSLHLFLGAEPREGELRLQAESKILDQVAFEPAKAAEIGRLHGVEVGIVGGFQEAAGRLLIVANFVDVETGLVIEAVRVEGSAAEEYVFDIQNELAEAVREVLPRVREKVRP